METPKLKKGVFTLKRNTTDKAIDVTEYAQSGTVGSQAPNNNGAISYSEYGFKQASRLDGSIQGLRVCLQKIYYDFKKEIKDNLFRQEELKRPIKVKIEEYKGDINKLTNRIEKVKTEDIPRTKEKISTLKEELSHIRKHPQEIIGDVAGKASFYIGLIILGFLTIYLFVFYSSASHSAFFKVFKLNEIGVANSIFDAKAIPAAWNDGLMELILILTIPFVFLGLGYLIHKFQEQRGLLKYLKISVLVIITFIFDGILAYEITEKIYNIKRENSFDNIPEYNIATALQSINFWLIIFAGFVVYLIWGFVFDFVIEAYSKLDKVKTAIEEKRKQTQDAELELRDLQVQIDKMSHTIQEHEKEISKLDVVLKGSIVEKDFQHDIFSFLTGWMAWMKQSGKAHNELDHADKVTHEFVNVTIQTIEATKAE